MTCIPSRISTFLGVAEDLKKNIMVKENELKGNFKNTKEKIETYFCPIGPYPNSPYWACPQLMQDPSAPTKWCMFPESMQRKFQPLKNERDAKKKVPRIETSDLIHDVMIRNYEELYIFE